MCTCMWIHVHNGYILCLGLPQNINNPLFYCRDQSIKRRYIYTDFYSRDEHVHLLMHISLAHRPGLICTCRVAVHKAGMPGMTMPECLKLVSNYSIVELDNTITLYCMCSTTKYTRNHDNCLSSPYIAHKSVTTLSIIILQDEEMTVTCT